MWVLQLGGELDLAAEAVDVQPRGEIGRQHLDDHVPFERRLGGDEDAAHPPATQLALDPVGVAQRLLEASHEVVHEALR